MTSSYATGAIGGPLPRLPGGVVEKDHPDSTSEVRADVVETGIASPLVAGLARLTSSTATAHRGLAIPVAVKSCAGVVCEPSVGALELHRRNCFAALLPGRLEVATSGL
jgi:hypothetical protein